VRTSLTVLAALLVLACVPAGALAHGDASMHYLETGTFYPAFGKRPSPHAELKLMGLIEAAQRAGYPLKVSLLGDPSDVNGNLQMFRAPQRYADYVARQLKLSGVPLKAPVLIVSPYGAGVAGPHAAPLTGVDVATGASGDQLAQAATTAVRSIAAAGGHPLPAHVPAAQVPVVKTPGSGYDFSGLTPFAVFLAIFGSAVVYLQIRTRMARRRLVRGA
jgi:hypothetical protein